MSTSPAFWRLWRNDDSRDALLGCLPQEDLASFRLACREFAVKSGSHLFKTLNVTFKPSTFTKPARMEALGRVGHYVQSLSFNMPHTPDTFLPPILDPTTGEELEFIYLPSISASKPLAARPSTPPYARPSSPLYGSPEMTDILVKQYPPLFHSATNVSSFIRALSLLPSLRRLSISTPKQDPLYRYRRSCVDYALISLRIAIERSPLPLLTNLALISIHPSAVQHLNPTMGLGALPSSTRRWRQIRDLTIHMDPIPHGPSMSTDHLKLLHSYLQTFALTLSRLTFHWTGGAKGLFPLALSAEQCLVANSPALACPRRCHLALRPLKMPKLVFLEVENVETDASQVSNFILAHRKSISEFKFEGTTLRKGTWDEALAPLTRLSGSEDWKRTPKPVVEVAEVEVEVAESMEVPLILSPMGLSQRQRERVVREAVLTRACPTPLLGSCLRKAREKGKGLLGLQGEGVRRFLRGSVSAWRQF